MNILLLGGAGFIGKQLAHKLLDTRHNRVTIIDNLVTSSINVDDFAEYKNLFNFIESDIREMDDKDLLKLFKKQHVIYHLAGSVGVEHIDMNPRETLFNNLELSNKLIPLFEKAKAHVVYASTSEVYGDKPEGSFAETDNASIGPSTTLRWGYACSKLMTEFMISASSFPFTIVRFFNVVGPGQVGDHGMVLPKFVKAAKAGEPLTIFGNGKQIRCFCHIDDALTALTTMPDYNGEIFNIGNDISHNINDLASMVLKVTKSKSEIIYIPYEDKFSKHHGDIMRRVPNMDKLKAKGYEPMKSLYNIIEDMI